MTDLMNDSEGMQKATGASAGKYAPINGLEMYYEIHSAGIENKHPLVLLHGSFSAIGTSFGKLLPSLAITRQVIAIEQQGHGHTADIDRPLSIEQMAMDTADLLHFIGIDRADFFGYSQGSGIALYLAIKRPELVHKAVLAGGVVYNRDGFHAGLLDGMDSLKPEFLVGSPYYDEYMAIAPNPEDFPKLVEKVKGLNKSLIDWSEEDIRSIQAPVMIMIGDSDIDRPEHAVEMFKLLGGGVPGDNAGLPRSRLAILPGTTHVTLVSRRDWLAPMINEFLDEGVLINENIT